MGRQRPHGDQLAQRRDRLAQLPDNVLQMQGILGVVPEILAVEQLQLVWHQGINAVPQDRGDRLVSLERELPLLPHVIRHRGAGGQTFIRMTAL